jgi:hypothetical protein
MINRTVDASSTATASPYRIEPGTGEISVVFDVLKSKNPELLVVIVRCKSNPVVTLVAQAVCII